MKTISAIGLFLFLSVGCTEQNPPAPAPTPRQALVAPPPPLSAISVREMGDHLGLTVVQSGPSMAELRGQDVRVRVYPEPHSMVYVNDQPVVKSGGIVTRGNEIYIPKHIEPQLRKGLPAAIVRVPPPAAQPPYRRVGGRVVIDAGHGGKDPGTHSAFGMREKDLTLAVARLVASKLERYGVSVLLTRRSDVFVELDERARLANVYRANLFVAIHADSNPSPSKIGHTILLPQSGSSRASAAARYVSAAMVSAGSPTHIVRTDDRGLVVLKKTACPAILVELGFLSNSTEARQLASAAYQDRLAEAIASGIADSLRH